MVYAVIVHQTNISHFQCSNVCKAFIIILQGGPRQFYLPSIPYSLHMGVTIPEEGRELTPYPLPCIPPCSYQYYRMLFTYRCYGFKLTNCPHRTFSFDQFYFIVTIKPPIIIFINLFLPSDFFEGEQKRNTGVQFPADS